MANEHLNPLCSPDVNLLFRDNKYRETSPENDCLSIISDYSEMGFQIKRSIKFNDVTMSTYADLKNPDKSITKLVVEDPQNNDEHDIRKYNMLSLAMEFARWKESQGQVDSALGDSISEEPSNAIVSGSESIWSVEDENPDKTALVLSLSDNYCDKHLLPDNHNDTLCCVNDDNDDSPLKAHANSKFEKNFCDTSNNGSNDEDDYNDDNGCGDDNHDRTKMTAPIWAQILRQKQILDKMPIEVQKKVSEIHKFDLRSPKSLNLFNLDELQITINCLFNQIEELNETLMMTLFIRDDLRSQQMELVNTVEQLTMCANQATHQMYSSPSSNYSASHSTRSTNPPPSIIHRFFSSLWNSPKSATSKVISLFNPHNTNCHLPKPEYV